MKSNRDLCITSAKVYLSEARRRRGQPFHAVLLRWAANSRKQLLGNNKKQMELFL